MLTHFLLNQIVLCAISADEEEKTTIILRKLSYIDEKQQKQHVTRSWIVNFSLIEYSFNFFDCSNLNF